MENEFRHLSSVTELVNIEDFQDAVQLKIGEFKHQFLTLQTPCSQGETEIFGNIFEIEILIFFTL